MSLDAIPCNKYRVINGRNTYIGANLSGPRRATSRPKKICSSAGQASLRFDGSNRQSGQSGPRAACPMTSVCNLHQRVVLYIRKAARAPLSPHSTSWFLPQHDVARESIYILKLQHRIFSDVSSVPSTLLTLTHPSRSCGMHTLILFSAFGSSARDAELVRGSHAGAGLSHGSPGGRERKRSGGHCCNGAGRNYRPGNIAVVAFVAIVFACVSIFACKYRRTVSKQGDFLSQAEVMTCGAVNA